MHVRSTCRTLGQHTSVTIFNASHVQHAALNADKACGAGTRLIYYMDVGEVLSRFFTAKDTHTARGDLVVSFTDAESHAECTRRAMATGILLGFSSPCFTFGSDLILPAETNELLRETLRSNQALQLARVQQNGRKAEQHRQENDVDDELTGGLASIAEIHGEYATVYIPEVWAERCVMMCTERTAM